MVCRPLRRFADGVGAVRPLVDGVEGSGGARWAVNPARLSASAPDANRVTVLAQAYTPGIDARLSRVSTLGFNSPNGTRYSVAAYRRAGMDLFAVVDYPAVDIQLDRTWSAADRKRRTIGWTSQAAGVYPGLDRFGRVVRQTRLDGVTGITASRYRPAIPEQIYTCDRAARRGMHLVQRMARLNPSPLPRETVQRSRSESPTRSKMSTANHGLPWPSKQCRKCGQPALADSSACAECGGASFSPLKRRRPPPSSDERWLAYSVSILILCVQVPTTAYPFVFEVSTFASNDPMVRDVEEGMVVLGLYCLASVAGLGWSFRRAVPMWVKALHVVLAFPLVWEVLRLVVWMAIDVKLPGFSK